MALSDDFVGSWSGIPRIDVLKMMKDKALPPGRLLVTVRDELRPSDIYCYLKGRYGPPNGIQMLWRGNHSNNLYHWDWTLRAGKGLVQMLGLNFRTEFVFIGDCGLTDTDRPQLIEQFKAGFASHGREMAEVRKSLESWSEFVNPFARIRKSLTTLIEELKSLSLDPATDSQLFGPGSDIRETQAKWNEVGKRYSKGLGLCFGIRSMLPVMAEAFVNVLLALLMKKELKADPRLRDNTIRQHIDIRVKSLPLTCDGFQTPIDFAHEACAKYHGLVNERNDLLHGNVAIDKLKFNHLFFDGTVPVFKSYRSMWERSLGVAIDSFGINSVFDEIAIINEFINYVLSCLKEDVRRDVTMVLERQHLGLNDKTQRLGILFDEILHDVFYGPLPGTKDSQDGHES